MLHAPPLRRRRFRRHVRPARKVPAGCDVSQRASLLAAPARPRGRGVPSGFACERDECPGSRLCAECGGEATPGASANVMSCGRAPRPGRRPREAVGVHIAPVAATLSINVSAIASLVDPGRRSLSPARACARRVRPVDPANTRICGFAMVAVRGAGPSHGRAPENTHRRGFPAPGTPEERALVGQPGLRGLRATGGHRSHPLSQRRCPGPPTECHPVEFHAHPE